MRSLCVSLLLLSLTSCVLCGSCIPTSDLFGDAFYYSLFVTGLGTVRGCNADVEGGVAANGPIDLAKYSVGNSLTQDNFPLDYALVGALGITFAQGNVRGGIFSQDNTGITNVQITNLAGVPYEPSEVCCALSSCEGCSSGITNPLNFNDLNDQVRDTSDFLASEAQTTGADAFRVNNNIHLYCSDAGYNVFNNVDVLSTDVALHIHCNAGQTVIINYAGSTDGYPAGFGVELVGGITASHIIHNFNQSPWLSFTTGVPGTVLAPGSVLSFPYGLITGNVIVDGYYTDAPDDVDICNGGQINYAPFDGCIPQIGPEWKN